MIILRSIPIGAVPRGGAVYGQGSGPVFLDLLWCSGLESQLFDCAHRGRLEPNTCGHDRDAGVVCVEGMESNVFYQLDDMNWLLF